VTVMNDGTLVALSEAQESNDSVAGRVSVRHGYGDLCVTTKGLTRTCDSE
jgi:hypothetical protein